MLKFMKISLVLSLIALITIGFTGCSFGGYQASRYFNMVYNSDNQQRLITIGRFKGKLTEEIKFNEAAELEVEIQVEKGEISIEFFDPEDQLIFEKKVTEADGYNEIFKKQFKSGNYKLSINSKSARNVEIKLMFRE